MPFKIPRHLNIRQKVIVGLTLGTIGVAAIGWLSYTHLLEIERKVHFVEFADDLNNIILEMRRYEKNFFLYGLPDALEENRRFTQSGLELIDEISPEAGRFRGAPQLQRIRSEMLAYRDLMERIASYENPAHNQELEALEEAIRERGKTLVDLAHSLVAFERERILLIIRSLKTQLLVSMAILVVLGIILVPFVSRKIIRPLRVIEKSTLRIAQGDFQPLEVLDTRDETQQVVEAFNRMVVELERRQDQLVQAKKLSSLGILTSGIAHQLNNPLNNISTSCQILLEELGEADPEFLRRMLTNVEQEVARARDIVKGLLEFSRAKEFSIAPVALTEVVERTVRLISSQVPPGIELVRQVPEDLVIPMDTQRMQQVFLNLFMNAIHAIKEPPGEIRIRAWEDPGSNQATVVVEDTGCGIPEENLGKVFDPFFTTKEVGAGTGLGLSIAYGIVQQHMGSIAVESRVGEGTRFTIRLPLKAPEGSTRRSA
jgi:signal transduction histidine kinase